MKKIISTFLTAGLLGITGSLLAPQLVHAQASATVGKVRGLIKDKATGEGAVGATVIATSAALQGQQVAITEDGGQYFITDLPPGMYTLTVYYVDAKFARGNVLIQLGKEAVVNIAIDTTTAKGETIEIQGSAPLIDQGSTKTGVVLTDDYTRNIPVGRTFGAVLGAAGGAQDDAFGESMSGATSNENTYIVEGINTTDTAFGLQAADLPNEFISETEIITGGYNAEYGRATGGIVNVTTKSGGNEVHGSVFGYWTPGSFSSEANTITSPGGGSITSKTDLANAYDVGAEVGGPIIKDKIWFHIGFAPSVTTDNNYRIIGTEVDANQDGIADVDKNGNPILKTIGQQNFPTTLKTYFFTSKLNGVVGKNNQWQISAFGNPQVGNVQVNDGLVHAPDDQLYHTNNGAIDVSGKWTSKLDDDKTELDAIVGYHRAYSRQTPTNSVGSDALTYYDYTRSLYDFADLEPGAVSACNTGAVGNPYPKLAQLCPVTNYAESGLGVLEQRDNNRGTVNLSATRRVKALGFHEFKAGFDLEISTYNSQQVDTGGEVLKRFCNSDPTDPNQTCNPTAAPGAWEQDQYEKIVRNLNPGEDPNSVALAPGQVLCAGNHAICAQGPGLFANTKDYSVGAYVRDSWTVLSNLTLDYGLRFERQQANTAAQLQGTIEPTGETVPKLGFALNNWAPRLGIIYDPTNEGKSKLFAHWGRFYENVPMDLNVRGFGGEIDSVGLLNSQQLTPGQTGYNPACNVDHMPGVRPSSVLAGCNDFSQTAVFGGGSEYVVPGLKGQYTDELLLGGELEVMPDLKVGITYMHRTLPQVIEDILTPDGSYMITNPGENFDAEAASLHTEATKLLASTSATDQAAGALDEYRSQQIARIKNFDPPQRNYDAVQLQVTQRPTKQSLISASYTYSRETGNYPGLFSTETNQIDPNGSSQFDLPALLANRYGPMGLDRPHNLKIAAFYMFDLKQLGLLTVGGNFDGQSGIAHNALGNDPVYGQGEAYLLPRGSEARSPFTTQFDIHVSYGRQLNKRYRAELFVNVFNLFNQQDTLTTDENYTFDSAAAIVGGDPTDLLHLKKHDPGTGNETSEVVTPNTNFGKPTALQAPRRIQLGFRLTF